MAIELYWGSGSPFAWRVMLTLEVKGLEYESKLLEFSKGDHKTPAYLKLNPRGKVPTLKDGDFVLYESLAIMSYIDRKYPDPPLFGKTPEETGLIWRWLAECESYVVSAGDKFSLVKDWRELKKSNRAHKHFATSLSVLMNASLALNG